MLSDIAGAEDHYGDMDFKVAGTANGITALQMDIKVTGITSEIMAKALEQARAGRLHILGEMAKTLRRHAQEHVHVRAAHHHHQDPRRQDPRRHRTRRQDDPQHHRAHRREDRRRGRWPGQRGLGRRNSAQKAISIIQELTATPELNKTYMGKVQRITDFGAFVEIMAGTDGLLHVSEIANHRVKDVRDELKEGQQILVKVINIDPTGKIRLSRKALLQEEAGKEPAPPGAARVDRHLIGRYLV